MRIVIAEDAAVIRAGLAEVLADRGQRSPPRSATPRP